ncbi:hypothetical protein DE146DRAFT_713468 [Phaeosphaeria sp. MPI-PUGE-AT-0046c]|nr:hypothetical protein DE146DRAFT_713468 [Phaeosphaeria sp. MPI-PUGE-AT-0046c]
MSKFDESDFPPLSVKIDPAALMFRTRDMGRQSDHPGRFATISDLPDELLVGILDYLPEIDLQDHQLKAIVSFSFICEPYLFLRTVSTNTGLASLVRNADFSYLSWAHHDRRRYIATARDKKAVKEGFRALGLSNWKQWATDCNTDNVELDTLHTAILMQTPNVESIILHDGELGSMIASRAPKWIDLFRRANFVVSFRGMHWFEHLHTLRIEIQHMTLTSLAPVFNTPSLRKLCISGLLEYDQGMQRTKENLEHIIPRNCNSLDEFHLEHSFIQNDILRVLVSSAQALKVFNYTMSLDNVSYQLEEEHLGTMTLVAALDSQKTTLRSLSFANDSEATFRLRATSNLCEGICGFSALKHLNCTVGNVAHMHDSSREPTLIDQLPPSLESFHTILSRESSEGQNEEVLHALEQMAAHCSEQTPNLATVRITYQYLGPYFKYDWARLVTLFSKTGVELLVEEDEDENDEWNRDWNDSPVYQGTPHFAVPPDTASSTSSGEVSLYSNPAPVPYVNNG